jgi:hypothetical protein
VSVHWESAFCELSKKKLGTCSLKFETPVSPARRLRDTFHKKLGFQVWKPPARRVYFERPSRLHCDQIKVMLRQTVSQSVCRGVKFTLEPVTRCYILSESCCVVQASYGPFQGTTTRT